VLAETHLIAWKRLDAVPAGDQARLWMFGVARNLVLQGAVVGCSANVVRVRLHRVRKRLAQQLAAGHPTTSAEQPRTWAQETAVWKICLRTDVRHASAR
jgi:DNA-directed RNA polymerase specialized sigma24 family protein